MRHTSAERYKGVAKVTIRRARKGFQLKYNPDFHWSNALYSLLNSLQLKDGSNITIINRDDSSGFHLDTLTTHIQYRTPSVIGCDTLTTNMPNFLCLTNQSLQNITGTFISLVEHQFQSALFHVCNGK